MTALAVHGTRQRQPVGVGRRLDWVLVLAALSLSGLGAVLVWSATRPRQIAVHADPDAYLKRHLLNLAIGGVLGAVAALVDYRLLRAYAPVLYLGALAGLVAVLSPLGSTVKGAHSWIVLPAGFAIQPSELAKVALVVGVALLLSEKRDAEDGPRHVDVIAVLAMTGVPLALVLLQPDLGTAMVMVFLVLGMITVSGAPLRWVVGLMAGGLLGGFLVLQAGVLEDYQVQRLTAFADPSADPRGAGYNTQQARIAIGSGGLWGRGLFEGPQTQGRFVPEQQTDFVFTVAGEELGFVGAAALLALLGIVLLRAYRTAVGAEDLFGRLVATGVLCWFTFQVFENVGMCLGIMPVTGLPLPFVSYGGSSMFANWLAIGLLQNVHMRRDP